MQAGLECCDKPNKWFMYCNSALVTRTSQISEHWNAASQKGKNKASVWLNRSKKCPISLKGGTSHFVCLCAYFSVLRTELRTAKCSFVHTVWCPMQLWKGKIHATESNQTQFFLCPKLLVNFCTQPWPFKPQEQTELALLLCRNYAMRQKHGLQVNPFSFFG